MGSASTTSRRLRTPTRCCFSIWARAIWARAMLLHDVAVMRCSHEMLPSALLVQAQCIVCVVQRGSVSAFLSAFRSRHVVPVDVVRALTCGSVIRAATVSASSSDLCPRGTCRVWFLSFSLIAPIEATVGRARRQHAGQSDLMLACRYWLSMAEAHAKGALAPPCVARAAIAIHCPHLRNLLQSKRPLCNTRMAGRARRTPQLARAGLQLLNQRARAT